MENLKALRSNPLYTSALVLHGNGKLLDYVVPETGESIRYAQLNTRPVIDCPFRSKGCEKICYATKGNHMFPSVKKSRENSYQETKRADFADALIYTIDVEKKSKRYKDATMEIRLHESGDFYSLQYLKKLVRVWEHVETIDGVKFCFYTKSFRFFLMLDANEKALINRLLKSGKLAMSFSLDDTTSKEQLSAYLECKRCYPRANTYQCTEHVESVRHDSECDCANCAKCGKCLKTEGKTVVVKIHSASNADMEEYRKNSGAV